MSSCSAPRGPPQPERPQATHNVAMLQLRILAPAELSADVVQILEADPGVSGLAVMKDAAIRPAGDLVLADIAREAANDIVDRLRATGVHREGTIEINRWTPGCRGARSTAK